jgi:eukaryotic-like serine/threonine-protein kinase
MKIKAFFKSKQFLINISLIILLFIILTYLTLTLLKTYTHHGKSLSVPDFHGLSIEQTEMLTKQHKLRYQIVDSAYVPDIIPGRVLTQHPLPDSKVKQRRTIYITIASVSPERVKVPAIVNVSLREAQSRLENAGLRLGIVEYRPSEYQNLVLGSRLRGDPYPLDTILPKGTLIDLIVGKGLSNEKTETPNLFGMYLADVRDIIYNSSLNMGVLIYDQTVISPTDTLNARVWKQNPKYAPNVQVELGVSINLWLTNDEEKLFVPENSDNNDNESEFHFDNTDS